MLQAWHASKTFFWMAVVLFFVSAYFGYVSDMFADYLNQQLAGLGQMAEEIESMNNPGLMFFVVIFLNNTVKSIVIMYAGLLLGVVPVFFIAVNGMLVGYLIRMFNDNATLTEFTVWEVIVKGLLPHGIIEIPIILLAAAYGMRLGWAVWTLMLRAITGRKEAGAHSEKTPNVRRLLRNSGALVLFISVALLVAALIETYVTTLLLAS